MRPTRRSNDDFTHKITVDTAELMGMLCCGEATARKVAAAAGATIKIGRRTLFSVPKIEAYIASQAGTTTE